MLVGSVWILLCKPCSNLFQHFIPAYDAQALERRWLAGREVAEKPVISACDALCVARVDVTQHRAGCA